ncbi:MAG: cobalamin biosynthesis protein CobD [Deltaproteobacteria bacterium]|nr:cobalamin biosynthesis protein CobD [Deltaproteobacteria bacterium]
MIKLLLIFFSGFLLDLIFGDPRYGFHPIRIIGKGIAGQEYLLRKYGLDGRAGGILLVSGILILTVLLYLLATYLFMYIHPAAAWLFDLYIFYSCLALKDLFYHIRPVISSLKGDNLPDARKAIAMVVGRDVDSLDREGIVRAAIETMAENFVDGFLTPLFWFITGGLSAGLFGLYPVPTALCMMLSARVASTLDSMVGYKNPEYLKFGRAGAGFDDIMNFVPARLSVIILFLGALFSRSHALVGLKTALRDRLKHDSPNAGHSESFMAGALGVRLGGPAIYRDKIKHKPWLGEEFPDPSIEHIIVTERVIMVSSWVSVIIAGGLTAAVC